jgi:hypothetical protein
LRLLRQRLDRLDTLTPGDYATVKRQVQALGGTLTPEAFVVQLEEEIRIKQALGLEKIIWLGQGLAEDTVRDPDRMYYGTDGHADLFLCFIAPRKALMLRPSAGDPNEPHLSASRAQLEREGIEVLGFPYMSGFLDEGRWFFYPI